MDNSLIERIENLSRRLVSKYNAKEAYLFGSYARGEADDESDVDILIVGGPDFIPSDIFAIAEELHIGLGKQVDVYELAEINEGTPFHTAVMSERRRVA
ncbi:MAG: nucleotidyltransferase domain-containing protein [Eggerthellaceae bacterium]